VSIAAYDSHRLKRAWWLAEINAVVMFAGPQQGDDFEIHFTGGAGQPV
jgi:hypothetical protein